MPVYNSYGHVRSEGKDLLRIAIDSLLAQTYTNFELIILDNQSTDKTPTIIRKYAKRDSRIRYIVDSRKRYPEGAITHLGSFIQGEFCMIANDDDIWDPKYIEKLHSYISGHPEVDLCYSNGSYVDIEGKAISVFISEPHYSYGLEEDNVYNLLKYIHYRNVLPIAFGIYRSRAFQENLPFNDFDKLKANVDNLFIIKFMSTGHKIHFLNDLLFNYRIKKRTLDPTKVLGMPTIDKPILIWQYYSLHQFNFCKEIIKLIHHGSLPATAKDLLTINTIDSCLDTIENLLKWIRSDVAKSNNDLIKISSTLAQTKYENMSNIPLVRSLNHSDINYIDQQSPIFLTMLKKTEIKIKILDSLIKRDYIPSIDKELTRNFLNSVRYNHQLLKRISTGIHKRNHLELITRTPSQLQVITKKPKISVIVTSYNLRRFLLATVYSILNQNFSNYELLIIDGKSIDGSVELIKQLADKYHQIRYISEKDTGYPEAFWRGVNLSRGEYIMQCAVSDTYASHDWFRICAEELDNDKEISLIWGFPQNMSESGKLRGVSYPIFQDSIASSKKGHFICWLKTGFYCPEGNLCVRKKVLKKCYPKLKEINAQTLDWLEFNYRFNRDGYLAKHIPIVANYGREHDKQLGAVLAGSGNLVVMNKNYNKKVNNYRFKLMLGLWKHTFKYPDGEKIRHITYNNTELSVIRDSFYRIALKNLKDFIYNIKEYLCKLLD